MKRNASPRRVFGGSIRIHDITSFRDEHDLHMVEGHRNAVWIKDLFIKDIMEMRGNENFRTLSASIQEVTKNPAEQPSTIC
jgi:hypothetical protein